MCYYDHAVLMSLKMDPWSSRHVAGTEPNHTAARKDSGLGERALRPHRRPPRRLISFADALRLLPGF